MPQAKYQFEDFLTTTPQSCHDFVTEIHHQLLKENYKPKITVTKSTGLQLAYHQPKIKTVAGIIMIFFMKNERLILRLYGKNNEHYPDLLDELPVEIVNQIDQAPDCVKFANPDKCWKGCIGYDFHIRGNHYQKCYVSGFQFEVDGESMPSLTRLIKSESKARSLYDIS